MTSESKGYVDGGAGALSGGHPIGADGLGSKTIGGAIWGALQVFLSKGLQMLGTLVIAIFVSKDGFGAAGVAISVATFVAIVNPVAVGDYLVQQQPLSRIVLRRTQRLGLSASAISGVFLLGFALAALWLDASLALVLALAVVSIRPLADTLFVVPQAILRQQLLFRQIASVDIVALAVSTAVSVAMAISGLGAVSLVAPLVLASCIRAIAYRRLLTRNAQHPVRADEFDEAPVGRGFTLMAAAQYVHILVNVVDWPIVWLFRSVSDAGTYYFAWNLSIQANSVISAQFAQTLQPVLVLLRFDPARQIQGFLRSLRVLASIAVPLALLQAAIARPAFHLLFGERWDSAIGGFVALSIGQSLAFSVGPVLALLKADGRTALLLKLQSAQLVFSVCALCIGGWLTRNVSDQGTAIFVIAIASTLQFLVFCPLSVWASLRGRGSEPAAAMLLFLRPLAAAIIPSVLAFYGAERLDELGSAGRSAACLVLPVGYLALYAIMLYAIDRPGASEVMTVVRATAGRLRQLRPRSR